MEHKVDINFMLFHCKDNFLAIAKYDYVFAENGLVAYKNGKQFFEEVCSIILNFIFNFFNRIFKNMLVKIIYKHLLIIV